MLDRDERIEVPEYPGPPRRAKRLFDGAEEE
jgi:hypothetical protein